MDSTQQDEDIMEALQVIVIPGAGFPELGCSIEGHVGLLTAASPASRFSAAGLGIIPISPG